MAHAPLELACTELGEGPPLLVLHGLFGSGTNWRGIARSLATAHRVLLVDARNHGASPHAPAMDYPAMAADVRALMDARGIDDATVLGHSMGGKTAMTLALETPERVAALAVVDIAPRRSPGDHGPLIDAMRSLDLSRVGRRGDADALLAERVADAGLRAFLLQNLENADGGYRWRINLDAIEACMPTLLGFDAAEGARFEGETLFVAGERSDYLTDADLPDIQRRFPRAELATVPDSGHWVHAENPRGFLAALSSLLPAAGRDATS